MDVSADGVPLRVRAKLGLASVATGSARRDADLCGPRLFDVQRDARLEELRGDVERAAGGLHAQLAGQHRARRRDAGIAVPRLLVGRAVAIEVEALPQAPKAAPPCSPSSLALPLRYFCRNTVAGYVALIAAFTHGYAFQTSLLVIQAGERQ